VSHIFVIFTLLVLKAVDVEYVFFLIAHNADEQKDVVSNCVLDCLYILLHHEKSALDATQLLMSERVSFDNIKDDIVIRFEEVEQHQLDKVRVDLID